MGIFSRGPKVGADGYERKSVRGYVTRGPVAKALADGWEIESVTPVQLTGTTLKQAIYLLKRKAG